MTDRAPTDRNGFTLLEVLIALAVFGLAAMALLNLMGENTRSAARVEARTWGGVVADNLAVEATLAPVLAEGAANGAVRLAGRDWRWIRTVAATEVGGIQRVEIRVSGGEGQVADRTVFRTRS